jgi:hypothetical protein
MVTMRSCSRLPIYVRAAEALTSSRAERLGIPTGSPAKQRCLRWVPDTTGLLHPKDATRLENHCACAWLG